MINTAKIHGRLAELSLDQKDIAAALRVTQPVLKQKLNNIRPMRLNEAEILMDLLKLDKDSFCDYFFC